MIDLYTWSTADGHCVATMLEAAQIPYRVHPVDVLNLQEQPRQFQAISPNKVPAITDPDGPDLQPLSIFGCAPVLIYLAEKSCRFLPEDASLRYQCLQWVIWQQSDVAPVLSKVHETLDANASLSRTLEHQTRLLWQALANQLSGKRFICGDDLTIADFALYPWIKSIQQPDIDPAALAPVQLWLEQLNDIEFMYNGLQIP